jgi:hypothetical protein
MSKGRKWLAVFAIAMLALAFAPTPITGASGRERWPGMRDASRETVHDLSNYVRHKLHRK